MAQVVIQRLSKTFPPPQKGGNPVVAIGDISLEVDGNVFVSIVGPSGCGKSTLLSMIERFYDPLSGEIVKFFSFSLHRSELFRFVEKPFL